MFEMTEMYRELGISEKVCQFGKETVSETDMQRVLVCG